MPNNKLLICTDLDRTLIPNGGQPESLMARSRFTELVSRENIYLAYVSGRHKALIEEAISEYSLPVPDFAIGDVGTTIYEIVDGQWLSMASWQVEISRDWLHYNGTDIASWLTDINILRLQEAEKQNRFKLSYYAPADIASKSLIVDIAKRLEQNGVKANIIWSVDETTSTGLLDILPVSANKLHAIHFLMQSKNFALQNTLFSGDSGNDLEVLCSDIPAVLVNNATDQVKQEARLMAKAQRTEAQLYLAHGDFFDMNGNYAAGILEGLIHYHPDLASLVK